MDPNIEDALTELNEARRGIDRAAGALPLAGAATARAFERLEWWLDATLREVEREAGAGRLAAA